MNSKNLLALLAILSLALFLNLSVNPEGKPLHLDEYQHLGVVRESIKAGELVPFYGFDASDAGLGSLYGRFESSFDTLLISLQLLIPAEPINLASAFTIFISMLLGLGAFIFGRRLFGSHLAGMVFAVSVFLIENNSALMGYLFMVPMSLAMAMMLILGYLFTRATLSKKYCIVFLLVFVNIVFVHPPFALLILLALSVFFVLHPKRLWHNKLKVLAGTVVIAAGAFYIENFSRYSLEKLFIWEFDKYVARYPFFDFITIPILALGIAGTVALLVLRLKGRLSSQQKMMGDFLVIAAVVGIGIRLYGEFTQNCFFGPCRRTTLSAMPFVFALAGIGIYIILLAVSKPFNSLAPNTRKASFLAIALLLALSLPFALNYTSLKNQGEIVSYSTMESFGVRATQWLSQNTGQDDIVFALPWNGQVISIISGAKVCPAWTAPQISNVLADPGRDKIGVLDFFNKDCAGKLELINGCNANWIYSRSDAVECDSVNKLYQVSSYNHSIYGVA